MNIVLKSLLVAGFMVSAVAAPNRVNVIIQFHPGPLDPQITRLQKAGAQLYRKLDVIHSASFSVSPAQLDSLRRLPGVASVHEESVVQQTMDDITPAVGATTAFSSGWTGKGVGVAIIDSGISVNADLTTSTGQSRLRYQQSFTPETITNDWYGHGTHIAGIIGGRGANSTGSQYSRVFRGIAPEANLVSLIALDRYGNGRESDVIAAISKAIQLKSTYNIRVLNLSLGKPVTKSYKSDPLCQAVEAAWKAGIVVVVSAGNEGRNNSKKTQGYATISSPGNDPYVITVGALRPMGTATRADDVLASYSQRDRRCSIMSSNRISWRPATRSSRSCPWMAGFGTQTARTPFPTATTSGTAPLNPAITISG